MIFGLRWISCKDNYVELGFLDVAKILACQIHCAIDLICEVFFQNLLIFSFLIFMRLHSFFGFTENVLNRIFRSHRCNFKMWWNWMQRSRKIFHRSVLKSPLSQQKGQESELQSSRILLEFHSIQHFIDLVSSPYLRNSEKVQFDSKPVGFPYSSRYGQ